MVIGHQLILVTPQLDDPVVDLSNDIIQGGARKLFDLVLKNPPSQYERQTSFIEGDASSKYLL